MSMYSLFYHSNIRLHISIINNFFFSKRLWYYIFAISHFVDYSYFFFFLEFTHCYMLSASLALSHWKLLLKKKCIMMSLFISPTQYCIVCKRKLRRKKIYLAIYKHIFRPIWDLFFMDCILYFILILWYQSVSFNSREMLHKNNF